MRPGPPAKYQIIRTEEFINKSHELGKIYPRIPELIKSLDWALARRPHGFTNVSGDFYLWVTEQLTHKDFPQIKVLYKIIEVDEKVILIDIDD